MGRDDFLRGRSAGLTVHATARVAIFGADVTHGSRKIAQSTGARTVLARYRCCEARVIPFDRITSDPNRMNGQPCIRNSRLTVKRVLEALATYPDRGELLREYPELESEDIRQALAYAAASLEDKVIELPKSA